MSNKHFDEQSIEEVDLMTRSTTKVCDASLSLRIFST